MQNNIIINQVNKLKIFKFSDNALSINISNVPIYQNQNNILARLLCSDDIIVLILATNAIRKEAPDCDINLKILYLPYGRQDRVCNKYEAFSLEAISEIINLQGYKNVSILDPHSNVTELLIKKSSHIFPYELYEDSIDDIILNHSEMEFNIISPDLGASKKTNQIIKYINGAYLVDEDKINLFQFIKERNLLTGEIIKTKSVESLESFRGKDFIIFDDICDGGTTFIEIAKVLKEAEANKIFLIVTHGIFSKGFTELEKYFTKIYTTNSYCKIEENKFLSVYKYF